MKTYNVIDKKTNIPEYCIKYHINSEGKELYELFYSYNSLWSKHIQGKLTLTMIDDGNHVSFKPVFKTTSIDYSDLEKIRILLSFHNKNQKLYSEFLIKEEILVTEI